MEKTKLGISVGVFGAFIYVVAAFGGYLAATIVAGYVLLMESNEWLKKTAIKAIATLACFSFAALVIGVIPDAINWVLSVINIFGTNLRLAFVDRVFSVLTSLIYLLKDVVFVVLIYKALNQGTLKLPVVDKLIDKYM